MKLSSYASLRVPNFGPNAMRRLLEEAGLDWRAALAEAGLAQDAVDRLGGTLPAQKDLAFQVAFAELTRDRTDLWMRAARAYTMGSFGVRGKALAAAPTIAAWVETAQATDYAPSILDLAALRTPDGTVTGIEYSYPDTPPALVPFSIYRDLSVIARTFSWIYGAPFPFTRVDFPLAAIADEAANQVSCSIVLTSTTLRIWWDPATSGEALPFGGTFQYESWLRADARILENLRANGDWHDTVARTIRAAPALHRLADVAAALRVSLRTPQRKLDACGCDFAEIRDATLGEVAADLLLDSDRSIARISRELGYAEPGSFTNAFKRWKGETPTAFRNGSAVS